jgi:putative flippase GtrA
MESAGTQSGEPGRVLRFLVSGAFNTGVTYALYLVALRYWQPAVAYTIVYAAGICLAYVLNRKFVFREHAGWRSVAATPLIYLVQYLFSLAVIQVWLMAGLPASLAPLPAILLSIPLTYVLTRLSFTRH